MAGVAGDEFYRLTITDAGYQCIFHVGIDAVGFIEHRRDAALGIQRGALVQRTFAQDHDLAMPGQTQRQR